MYSVGVVSICCTAISYSLFPFTLLRLQVDEEDLIKPQYSIDKTIIRMFYSHFRTFCFAVNDKGLSILITIYTTDCFSYSVYILIVYVVNIWLQVISTCSRMVSDENDTFVKIYNKKDIIYFIFRNSELKFSLVIEYIYCYWSTNW